MGRASVSCSLPYKGMTYVPQTLDPIHLTRHPRGICPHSRALAGQLGIRQEAQGLPTVPPYFLDTAQPWFLLVTTLSRCLPQREGTSDFKNPPGLRLNVQPEIWGSSPLRFTLWGPSQLPNWEK